jgi:hypothetical protein
MQSIDQRLGLLDLLFPGAKHFAEVLARLGNQIILVLLGRGSPALQQCSAGANYDRGNWREIARGADIAAAPPLGPGLAYWSSVRLTAASSDQEVVDFDELYRFPRIIASKPMRAPISPVRPVSHDRASSRRSLRSARRATYNSRIPSSLR